MNVTIEEIIYSDLQNRVIFRAADEEGTRSRYTSFGVLPRCPVAGECWSLEYTPDQHPQYGPQRKVTKGNLIRPAGRFIVQLLAKHPALRGLNVGPVTARRLYQNHGTDLATILTSGDAKALPELDYYTACELCERWQALALEPDVVRWIDERGLDPRVASKVVAIYGERAVEVLETNPYVLLPFLPFEKIDHVARTKLGIDNLDPRRMVAAVESVLYADIEERGNTATRRRELLTSLRSGLQDSAERAVELALEQQVIFARGDFIQAYAPAMMERGLETWVNQVSASNNGQMSLLNETDNLVHLINGTAGEGVLLTDEQKRALFGALRNNIHCIIGGAGVGKTTVLRMLAKLIREINGKAFFMAISGRAARRIAEALDTELASHFTISTVAGYLRSVAGATSSESAPWLIVDEASMLDLQNAYKVITRSPPGARVVLVGDPHQLPPVGAGLVFHRLVECACVPQTELTTVFRHAEETGIPPVARAVRSGVFPDLKPFSTAGHGVQFQSAEPQDVIGEAMRIYDLLATRGEVQILTLFRTAYGATAVNNAMHARIPTTAPRLAYPFDVAIGEPVIYTKNDAELGLQNGSVGRVIEVHSEDNAITVLWDDGVARAIKGQDLWNCDLAYAITTHKSQGSQYERVIIVIPRASRILDRTLVYTAITRAKAQAVIIGDSNAVRQAVAADPNACRRRTLFLSRTFSTAAEKDSL